MVPKLTPINVFINNKPFRKNYFWGYAQIAKFENFFRPFLIKLQTYFVLNFADILNKKNKEKQKEEEKKQKTAALFVNFFKKKG